MSLITALTRVLPLLAVGLAMVGCASSRATHMSEAESAALISKQEKEINRLSVEMASMEKTLTDEQKARLALEDGSREDMLLPPDAKPGQCFARVFLPPRYEIETVRVRESDASRKIEAVAARYGTVEQRVLVKEATERLEVVPAEYEWVEEKMMVRAASSKFVTVPAQYRTVTEKVLDKPEHTVWKKGSGPITRIDEATGEIMCLITVPATYKTVTKRILVSDATTEEVEIPAEYKIVKKRVMKTPPTTRKVEIPPEYKMVKVRELVTPASTRTIEIPASYTTVKRRNKIADGHVEWRPVLCKTNMTSDIVRQIQTALDREGYPPGPIDGIIGQRTLGAVKQYQQARGLASGGLTLQTLDALKLNY